MIWTLSIATYLEDAPFPCSKDELLDYAKRSGAPRVLIENLRELEDDIYECVSDIWEEYAEWRTIGGGYDEEEY